MTTEEALQKKNLLRYKNQDAATARLAEVSAAIPQFAANERIIRSFPSRMLAIYKSKENVEEKICALKNEIDGINKLQRELLVQNGYDADYCEPKFECEKCRDTGYENGVLCKCVKRMLAESNYAESGIGKVLMDKTFDSFSLSFYSRTPVKQGEESEYDSMARVYKKCMSFADKFPDCKNILMMGGTGLGKTHLSAAIATKVISRGYSAHYDTAPSVFSTFDAVRFRRLDSGATGVYFDCDLLILDDLGAENTSAQNVSVLFELINSRILSSKLTVISTNLSFGDLKRIYNERIVSRLIGEYTLLQFVGKDVRRQKIGL